MKEKWNKVPRPAQIILYVIGGLILAGVLGFLFGIIIQSLWNWLMPSIFNLRLITYWEGYGLFILSCVLFGRIGGAHHEKTNTKKECCCDDCCCDENQDKQQKTEQ